MKIYPINQDSAIYILNHFPYLLNKKERLAKRHLWSLEKLPHDLSHHEQGPGFKKNNWISSDPEVLKLLKNGYEYFIIRTASRILEENADKVFLNNCPRCNRLARTPQARQCRHCGHTWHNLTVAKFNFQTAIQHNKLAFFLLGRISQGKVKVGHYIDLTKIGLNAKPKIYHIEHGLKKKDGQIWDDIALGTDDLSLEQQEFLKNLSTFTHTFDIVLDQ
ncbi:MAG: hypothetical protein NW226_09735 [Microscillaceae bacterium]|nr:hypothetical protein [Microscillaceae bacterium]